MIAYFDTSAWIPLLLNEATTHQSLTLWNGAARATSARLLYAEARSALARAWRANRISAKGHRNAVERMEVLHNDLDHIEINEQLVRVAGELAERMQLRGYDAVHLAAALEAADPDLVFVTGDATLAAAGRQVGLAVAHLAA